MTLAVVASVTFYILDPVKILKKILSFLIPLLLSAALLFYIYSDENLDDQLEYIKNGNMFWLFLPVFISLLSNLFRALRWNMLIRAAGQEVSWLNSFLAVTVGYLANTLLPRAGEVARCGVLKKYSDVSFTTALGTVVTERIFDVIITLAILLLAFLLEFNALTPFFEDADFSSKLIAFITSPFFIASVLIVAVAFVIFYRFRNQSRLYEKGRESLRKFKVGFLSAKDIDNKFLFGVYTVLIFACYYFMLQVSFWAFDFSKDITYSQGLMIYVAGSLGIIAPVQGGIGAWHYMTIQSMVFYLGNSVMAETKAFALVVHTLQSILVSIVFGLIAYVLLPLVNKKK